MIPDIYNCGIIKEPKSYKISLERTLPVQMIINEIIILTGNKMCDLVNNTSRGVTQCWYSFLLLLAGQGVVVTSSVHSDHVYYDAMKEMGYITPNCKFCEMCIIYTFLTVNICVMATTFTIKILPIDT